MSVEKKERACITCKATHVKFECMGPTRQRRTCTACTKHYCYIVTDKKNKRRYYRGYTVDPPRRLAQHRGERVGGARSTRRMKEPEFALVLQNFTSAHHALRFEWLMKHHRPKARTLKQAVDKALFLMRDDAEFAMVRRADEQGENVMSRV